MDLCAAPGAVLAFLLSVGYMDFCWNGDHLMSAVQAEKGFIMKPTGSSKSFRKKTGNCQKEVDISGPTVGFFVWNQEKRHSGLKLIKTECNCQSTNNCWKRATVTLTRCHFRGSWTLTTNRGALVQSNLLMTPDFSFRKYFLHNLYSIFNDSPWAFEYLIHLKFLKYAELFPAPFWLCTLNTF